MNSKLSKLIGLFVVLAIVFFAYQPTLQNNFVEWDDDVHLLDNLTLRGLDKEHIVRMFTDRVNKIYIPLTTFSFALEYHFYGLKPFVYHLDNLILHLLVVGFVYVFALQFGLSTLGACVTALIFGVHPVHVESVSWVTERKDVLYAIFYIMAMVVYCHGLKIKTKGKIVSFYFLLGITMLLGILSMLAKPMALSLPLILLLLDWFYSVKSAPQIEKPSRKIGWGIFLEKVPLFAIVAGITYWGTYSLHARVPGNNIFEGALIWSWTFMFYLKQFVFPQVSVPIYTLARPISLFNYQYIICSVLLILIIFLLFRLKKYRWFIFSFGFYFLSIFFLLRFDDTKDINIVADRFMYLPMLGFCLLTGYMAECLYKHREDFQYYIIRLPIRWIKYAAFIFLLVMVILFSIKTNGLTQVWKNGETLWRHQIKYFPNTADAYNNLVVYLRGKDEYKEAEQAYKEFLAEKPPKVSGPLLEQIKKVEFLIGTYKQAIQIQPGLLPANIGIAKLYQDLGLLDKALVHYLKAIEIAPDNGDAYFNLGNLYRDRNEVDKAIWAYNQDIATNEKNENIYINVIYAYNKALKTNPQNDLYARARQQSLKMYLDLIRSKPPSATSFANLAALYEDMGNRKQALTFYEKALEINPNYAKAKFNLGNLYRDLGLDNKALSLYEESGNNTFRDSDMLVNKGIIYLKNKDYSAAAQSFEEAIKMYPDNAKAYFNMGYLNEIQGKHQESIPHFVMFVKMEPKDPRGYFSLANAYARIDSKELALDNYLKTIELDETHVDAWINLSIISFMLEQYEDAVSYCQKAVSLGYEAPVEYLQSLEQLTGQKIE